MNKSTKQIGDQGEAIALEELQKNGFVILDKNWRHGHDELDIVCENETQIVFVEVKTRSFINWDDPESWVSKKKQSNLIRVAEAYLTQNEIDKEARFDIIAVQLSSGPPKVVHIHDAFYPLR